MIEKLPELVNNNEALIRRGRWLNDVFLVEVGEIQYLVPVAAGRVEAGRMICTRALTCTQRW